MIFIANIIKSYSNNNSPMSYIDVYEDISDNISNNFPSAKVYLNSLRNIVGMGNLNLDSTIIGLIKSIKIIESLKYNEWLYQVHNNTINDTYNSPYNEIKVTIKDKMKYVSLLSLLTIPSRNPW